MAFIICLSDNRKPISHMNPVVPIWNKRGNALEFMSKNAATGFLNRNKDEVIHLVYGVTDISQLRIDIRERDDVEVDHAISNVWEYEDESTRWWRK